MKKILATLVMALFLFSLVPVVFAEEGSNGDKNGIGNVLTNAPGPSEQQKEVRKAEMDKLKEEKKTEREQERESKKAEFESKKAEREQERESKKAELEAKKAKREQERESKKAERDQLREQLKSCKGDDKTETCKQSKNKMKLDVKDRLLEQDDKVVELINDLKGKIEKLNPANAADLVASLDAEMAKVEATKTKLSALTENSTKEEVKAVSQELQNEWTSARKSVRLHATRMMAVGFERVLVKAEKLESKLETTLTGLKAKGFDTSVAQTKIDEFKTHVADSRKAYGEAKVLLTDYQKDASKENAVQAIQEKMNVAKKALQDAQQSLKDLVKEVKKANGGAQALEKASKEADKDAKVESDKVEQEDADKIVTAPAATTTATA